MTRKELEQLCQPQTPEEVLEELESAYNEGGGDDAPLGLMPGMMALKATIGILKKLIEEADMSPSVKVRRIVW
jgi:hypothetical protein